MPTCSTGRKRWALAVAALALLFPSPGRSAGPAVIEEVVYQGAKHLKDDELNQLTGVRKGEPLDPAKNLAACRRIVARLHKDGRPFATCDLLSGGSEKQTRVVFNVTEGPKVRIVGVEFTGNNFVGADVLKARLKSTEFQPSIGAIAAAYNPEAVEQDVREIEDYYRSFGFREVHVSREVRWAPDGHSVVLRFHIEEGTRSRPSQPAGTEPVGGTAPLFQQ
jgi:outer membrane protein insertion porin family